MDYVEMMRQQITIITRFNLPLRFDGVQSSSLVNLDPDWLENRKSLFKRFCLPTLLWQTHADFKWFVLFDPATSKLYVDDICCIPQAIPLFALSIGDALRIIREDHTNYPVEMATIRLDSDDSIARTLLSQISQCLNTANDLFDQSDYVISFTNGLERDTSTNTFYSRYYPANMFLALRETLQSSKEFRSVFKCAHYDLPRQTNTISFKNKEPNWCVNVHGGNVANVIKGIETKLDIGDFSKL